MVDMRPLLLVFLAVSILAAPMDPGHEIRRTDSGMANRQSLFQEFAGKGLEPILFQPILLNEADAATLQTIDGIGEVLAQRIVLKRRQLGKFTNLDQLDDVHGIGPAKLRKLKKTLTLDKSRRTQAVDQT